MDNAVYTRMLVFAKRLQKICDVSMEHFKRTGDDSYKELAVLTGMLMCSVDSCRRRSVAVVDKKAYCKIHLPLPE